MSPRAAVHTGLFFASLGHDVTLSDITQAMLDRAAKAAARTRIVRYDPPSSCGGFFRMRMKASIW
jgi:hypothetical protein